VSGLFLMTPWNQTIPDSFRGRLAGIEMVGYMRRPLLGNAKAGLVAKLFSVKTSLGLCWEAGFPCGDPDWR
jgi:hypothetical protein